MQLDIFVEFEVEMTKENENEEDIGCGGGGAVERSKLGPFGLLVIADQTLSELTPIYFRPQNSIHNNTYFCADETRFVFYDPPIHFALFRLEMLMRCVFF